jgi:2-polyprenyl-3-methyl-5-hydroxy-6-metoxy-1,4-benzoquinol methylase
MGKYHKYVFDVEQRKYIGAFEEMYQNESKENFDSWHQDDTSQIHRQLSLALLNAYQFNSIIDLGCGKGTFTHLLKKQNNNVTGVDISTTAINIASEKFPNITFKTLDSSIIKTLDRFLNECDKKEKTDLIFCAEMFSYLENWKDVIKCISKRTQYFYTTLFIPENPIGFVKSSKEFIECIEEYFNIIEVAQLKKSRFNLVLAKRKS